MRRILLIFCSLVFYIIANAQPTFQWAKGMNGSGDSYGRAVGIDGGGFIYSVGKLDGTVDFDPGPGVWNLSAGTFNNFYIMKLDPSGNLLWAKGFDGSHSCTAFDIQVNFNGDFYICGYIEDTVDFDPGPGIYNLIPHYRDAYAAKYDSDCDLIWAKNIGGTGNVLASGVAADASGNVFMTGHMIATVDFDPGAGVYNLSSSGYTDIYVLKLDPSGNFLWAKVYGDPGTAGEYGHGIAVDNSGSVYSIGSFHGTLDFDPGPGTINVTSASGNGTVISKYDAAGTFVWAKMFDGPGSGYDVTIDPSGNVLSTGYCSNTTDFDPGPGTYNLVATGFDVFVSKLDSNGNFIWAKRAGGPQIAEGLELKTDGLGNVYVGGYFSDVVDFDPGTVVYNLTSPTSSSAMRFDAFVLKLNAAGTFLWAKRMGGLEDDQAYAIAIDWYGSKIVTTGSFHSSADFDPSAASFLLNATGTNENIFVQQMSQPPVGIEEYSSLTGFAVFPNPASDYLELVAEKEIIVKVIDLTGRELFTVDASSRTRINISDLSPGIYFVQDVKTGKTLKFVRR